MPSTFNGDCHDLASVVLGRAERCLLYGPAGTGKTYAATRVKARPDQRIFSITLTPDTPAAELRGHYVPRGGEFVWQDGPAVTARYRIAGARLVLNELHLAGPDVQALLHAILDDAASSTITLPTGEILEAAPGTEVVATMNGEPGDLPDLALLDRFPVKILIDKPHANAVAMLPQHLQAAALSMLSCPDDSRRVGMRAWLGYAALLKEVEQGGLSEEAALSAVFGSRASDIADAIAIAAADGPSAGR